MIPIPPRTRMIPNPVRTPLQSSARNQKSMPRTATIHRAFQADSMPLNLRPQPATLQEGF